MPKTEKELLFSVSDALEKIPICRSAMYNAIKKGEIPVVRIGRKILIPAYFINQLSEPESKG